MGGRAGVVAPWLVSFLVACAPVRPAVSFQWDEEGNAASSQLDTSKLPDAARSHFDAEKVWVVDSDTNESSYAFRNHAGPIPDATFFVRYRETTGLADLDDTMHRSPGTPLAVGGVLASAAGVIGALVLVVAIQPGQSCGTAMLGQTVCFTNQPDQGALVVGELGFSALFLAGAALVVAGVHANRAAHELSRDDAERFAHQYDEALLRAANVPTEPSP